MQTTITANMKIFYIFECDGMYCYTNVAVKGNHTNFNISFLYGKSDCGSFSSLKTITSSLKQIKQWHKCCK